MFSRRNYKKAGARDYIKQMLKVKDQSDEIQSSVNKALHKLSFEELNDLEGLIWSVTEGKRN